MLTLEQAIALVTYGDNDTSYTILEVQFGCIRYGRQYLMKMKRQYPQGNDIKIDGGNIITIVRVTAVQ